MNQFYVEKDQITGDSICITGEDVNHIKNVLRMREDEQIKVCDQEGMDYICSIQSMENKEVHVKIIEKNPSVTELPVKIYLFQGLPKKDKMDLIIQKNVELGVHQIIPVAMKRSVVKIEDPKKEKKKLERWQSIAESAAKQSKRAMIPQVTNVVSFKEALKLASQMDLNIFPYEDARGMQYSRDLVKQADNVKSIGIMIGPEGGFAEEEIEAIRAAGIEPMTLGKRILRTETAGFCIMSVLMFELEQE